MTRIFLIMFAALALLACGQTPDKLTPAERASVAVMGSRTLDDNVTLEFFVACGGVAIAPRTILTAGHCAEKSEVFFVDADTFLTTSDAKTLATVEQLPGDLAFLTPDHDLAHWVPLAAPPASGVVPLVRIQDSEFVTSEARIEGFRILSPMLYHGNSGSGLFSNDASAAIGVALTCTAPDDVMCTADGGRFGTPLQ